MEWHFIFNSAELHSEKEKEHLVRVLAKKKNFLTYIWWHILLFERKVLEYLEIEAWKKLFHILSVTASLLENTKDLHFQPYICGDFEHG